MSEPMRLQVLVANLNEWAYVEAQIVNDMLYVAPLGTTATESDDNGTMSAWIAAPVRLENHSPLPTQFEIA